MQLSRQTEVALAKKPALMGRLYNNGCKSLDDAELQRCFADVCGPKTCIRNVQHLRDNGLITIEEVLAA